MDRNVLLLCESSGGETITMLSFLRKRRKVQKNGREVDRFIFKVDEK